MATVEIDGVGVVELDDSFLELSEADQKNTIDEIFAKHSSASKPKPRLSPVAAKALETSSGLEKANAMAKAVNTGFLADMLGAPVDFANTLLSAVGLGQEEPRGGSKNLQRTLAAGGMGYMDESDLPEDQRALARGARTFGQGLGTLVPVFAASRRLSAAQALAPTTMTGSAIGTAGREMVKTTARDPLKMAALEGGALASASYGRAISEKVGPADFLVDSVGEETAREIQGTISEVVAGFANPTTVASKLIDRGGALVGGMTQGLTKSGREAEASRKILQILEDNKFLTKDFSDDAKIETLAKQLESVEGFGTTAQVTQDPQARQIFTALQNKLVSEGREELKTAVAEQTKKAMSDFDKKIRKLQNSGDPEMVKEAARLRLEMFTKNVDKRVTDAEKLMGEAVAKVLNKNPDDAVTASIRAREIIDNELAKARDMESKLWGEIDKDIEVPNLGKNTVKTVDSIKENMLPEEKLPAPIEAFVNRLRVNQGVGKGVEPYFQRPSDLKPTKRAIPKPTPLSAKELFRARNRALELAREAKASNKFGKQRRLNEIAEAMLEDLDTVVDESANLARDFSRGLNKRFNTKQIRGIREVEPDLALQKGIGTGLGQGSDNLRAVNMRLMKLATESDEATKALHVAQRDFIQSTMARVIDPQTGRVNPNDLARLVRDNPQTFKEVGLIDDVNDLNQQAQLVRGLEKTAKLGKAFAKKRSLVGMILDKNETKGGLTSVLNRAFTSRYQADSFRDLFRMVQRSKNPDAIEGLRHAVFDKLLDDAKIKTGELQGFISGRALEDSLNSVFQGKTLRQNLLSSKLITPDQLTQLAQVSRKARILEDSANDPRKLNAVIKTGEGLTNLLARIAGSKVGQNSPLSNIAGGSNLVIQGAFSKYAQKVLEKVPALKLQGVITKAIQDPQFMAYLLRKKPKFIDKKTNTRIKAYLLSNALLDSEEFMSQNMEFIEKSREVVNYLMDKPNQEEQPTNP